MHFFLIPEGTAFFEDMSTKKGPIGWI